MGLAEQWDRAKQRSDDDAEAQELRDSARADMLRKEFDGYIQQRNLDVQVFSGPHETLKDLLIDVTILMDSTIHDSILSAFIQCAADGHPKAVEAMEKVKQYFVEEVMA